MIKTVYANHTINIIIITIVIMATITTTVTTVMMMMVINMCIFELMFFQLYSCLVFGKLDNISLSCIYVYSKEFKAPVNICFIKVRKKE